MNINDTDRDVTENAATFTDRDEEELRELFDRTAPSVDHDAVMRLADHAARLGRSSELTDTPFAGDRRAAVVPWRRRGRALALVGAAVAAVIAAAVGLSGWPGEQPESAGYLVHVATRATQPRRSDDGAPVNARTSVATRTSALVGDDLTSQDAVALQDEAVDELFEGFGVDVDDALDQVWQDSDWSQTGGTTGGVVSSEGFDIGTDLRVGVLP